MNKGKFVINRGTYLKPHYPYAVLFLKSCVRVLLLVGREENAVSLISIPCASWWVLQLRGEEPSVKCNLETQLATSIRRSLMMLFRSGRGGGQEPPPGGGGGTGTSRRALVASRGALRRSAGSAHRRPPRAGWGGHGPRLTPPAPSAIFDFSAFWLRLSPPLILNIAFPFLADSVVDHDSLLALL